MPIRLSLPILRVRSKSFLDSFSEKFIEYLWYVRHYARSENSSQFILEFSKAVHLQLEWVPQSPGELFKTLGPIPRVSDSLDLGGAQEFAFPFIFSKNHFITIITILFTSFGSINKIINCI